ncbi:MAG TPA: FAD-dependent oxidoreductase, partial [Chitinophagaceae bacterium]|nr:FAD-dependent oxidoreductase [Chitinophagaceae bacterium]
MQADVIIIGAGAAGLMAAKELAESGKKVAVLEARNRVGGRINTIQTGGFSQPVETGAEFIHGNLELTLQLLKEAGLKTLPAERAAWRSKEGRLNQQEDFIENAGALMQALDKQKEESSVATFLNTHFKDREHADLKKSVLGYVEGYYAGNPAQASILALKEEWSQEEAPQHRVHGGYTKLMQWLYEKCVASGVVFHFSQPVKTCTWGFEKVEIESTTGAYFTGTKLITTIPVSLLQQPQTAATITFKPNLPEYEA